MDTNALDTAVSTLSWEAAGLTPEEKKTWSDNRRNHISNMESEWKLWLTSTYGYGLSEDITDRIFEVARNRGDGYFAVDRLYQEISALARICFDAGRSAERS